ncbi:PIF1-like helicase-domain-containing protein, partial [Flagelloscypha sp. PMI_526]
MLEAIANLADGPQLRFLFAVLIQEEANAPRLWEHFHDEMSADHRRRGLNQTMAYHESLRNIAYILSTSSRSLDQYGLPIPPDLNLSGVHAELGAFVRFRKQLRDKAAGLRASMTPQQQAHYDMLLDVCSNPPNGNVCFFLEGKAGRGKSFVTSTLAHQLRGDGKIVLIAGSTAKSVQGYAWGRTMHNLFHIPVTEDCSNVHSRLLHSPNHPDAVLIRHSDLILLEELTMANISTLESIDEVLRFIMGVDIPFGG